MAGDIVLYGEYDESAAQEDQKEAARGGSKILELRVGRNRLRFAPPPVGRKSPFVNTWQHFFDLDDEEKVSFNCPKMMNRTFCPVDFLVSLLLQTGDEADSQLSYDMAAKLRVYGLVIDREDEEKGLQPLAWGKKIATSLTSLRGDPDSGVNYTHPITGRDIIITREGTGLKTKYPSILAVNKSTPMFALPNGEPDMDAINFALQSPPDIYRYGRVDSLQDILKALRGESGNNEFIPALAQRLGLDLESHIEMGMRGVEQKPTAPKSVVAEKPARRSTIEDDVTDVQVVRDVPATPQDV